MNSKKVVIIKGKGRTKEWWTHYHKLNSAMGCELWTLNDDLLPLSDRHFDLHTHGGHDKHIAALWGNNPRRLFCYINPTKEPKHSWQVPFPTDALRWGTVGFSVCKSTVSYMLAMAIYAGAEKIILVGCDFGGNNLERKPQKNCAENWICYGLGKGIEIEWPFGMSQFFENRDNYAI